jgi:DDE superfamily endonuclease
VCILLGWPLKSSRIQLQENPDYFLDELLHLLKTNRFISVHYATTYCELKRRGVSLKKLERVANERNNEIRADFIGRMAQYGPEEIGFIDESSKDERTICRRFGRARKGTRAAKQQVFIRGRRTTITGLLSMNGLVAGTVVEGSMTKAMFMEFLEFTVVRTVKFCLIM